MTTVQPSVAEQAFRDHLQWIGRDIDHWLSLFHDDAVIEFPYGANIGRTTRLEGKEAIAGYMRHAAQSLKGLEFSRVIIHSVDDKLAIAEFHGEALVGEAAVPYSQDYIATITMEGALIRTYREYWDPTRVQAAARALEESSKGEGESA